MQRIATLTQTVALIALSLFSGALLFVAVVVVPFWLAADPQVFLAWMADHFFRFPLLMVPLNLTALLAAIAALTMVWDTPAKRLPWALGVFCLLLCTVTFPLYFADANAEFLSGSLALSDVASHIKSWAAWNWTRTTLALFAIAFATWGIVQPAQSKQQATLKVVEFRRT